MPGAGRSVVTWGEFDRRADALAADLVAAGLGHQSKVACYLYNGPEYLETLVAAFKAAWCRSTPTTATGPDEIVYLFDNADAEAVVFHATFAELLEGIRDRLPEGPSLVRRRRDPAPARTGRRRTSRWSTRAPTARAHRWGRSGDDLLLLYTGGTTGMPKGVMWRQDDLFNVLGAGGNPCSAPAGGRRRRGGRADRRRRARRRR